jgi:hypothetical protein
MQISVLNRKLKEWVSLRPKHSVHRRISPAWLSARAPTMPASLLRSKRNSAISHWPASTRSRKKARGVFLARRDRLAKKSLRQVDYAWTVLSRILKWGVGRGETALRRARLPLLVSQVRFEPFIAKFHRGPAQAGTPKAEMQSNIAGRSVSPIGCRGSALGLGGAKTPTCCGAVKWRSPAPPIPERFALP